MEKNGFFLALAVFFLVFGLGQDIHAHVLSGKEGKIVFTLSSTERFEIRAEPQLKGQCANMVSIWFMKGEHAFYIGYDCIDLHLKRMVLMLRAAVEGRIEQRESLMPSHEFPTRDIGYWLNEYVHNQADFPCIGHRQYDNWIGLGCLLCTGYEFIAWIYNIASLVKLCIFPPVPE